MPIALAGSLTCGDIFKRHCKSDLGGHVSPTLLHSPIHSTHSIDIEWVNLRAYNFFVSGSKFTKFSSLNVGGAAAVVAHLIFQHFMSPSVPEIFAIKG